MTGKRIEFLDFPLDVDVDTEAVCALLRKKGPRLITFINPSAWALAARRPEYPELLQQMSLTLADGEGVARACRWLTGENCRRLSFDMSSLARPFLKAAEKAKASVMLVGGKPGVDEEVHSKLHIHMPDLNIIGSTHGFGALSTKVEVVMKKAPDVIIVGMGSPRQEAFLVALREAKYKGLAITCGGFFDQYLLADPYYPLWVDRLNLRWAYRLYMEPGRLWRRYLLDYPVFIRLVFNAYAKKSQKAFVKRRGK